MKDYPVLSIILFGSSARGESDMYSDLDVCVVTKNKLDEADSQDLRSIVASRYGFSAEEITIYDSDQIDRMIKYGSLFLWHLKLEGKIIYDDEYFVNVIRKLTAYNNHVAELYYHAELLDDIISSFEKFHFINELDLSQLFTICRNACMILAHFNKYYAFGRKSAFVAANNIYGDLPLKQDDYDYLAKWKLRYERGQFEEMKLPSEHEFCAFVKKTKTMLMYSMQKVSDNG